MLCETLCDVFAQARCPVRARLCVLLDSAWMVNTWCGCNVRVVVLTMEHINSCAVNGTQSRFVRWSLIFWNKLVSGYLCHCSLCCGMLCRTIYFSRWFKKLIIYFYSCITILFSSLSIANCYESIKMKFHATLTHRLPFDLFAVSCVLPCEAGL